MNTWTPLWSGIVESSLWEESGDVVKVFMTLLARKDSDDICRLNAFNIHRICNIGEVEVLEILKVLASPDTRRIEKQEHDGRRIQAVDGGWFILNGQKYRDMVERERKQARWRRAQANQRAVKAGKPLPYPPADREITYEELAAHSDVQRTVQHLSAVQRKAEESANVGQD